MVILLDIDETRYNCFRNVLGVSSSKLLLLIRRVFVLGAYACVTDYVSNSNSFTLGSHRVLNLGKFLKTLKICVIRKISNFFLSARLQGVNLGRRMATVFLKIALWIIVAFLEIRLHLLPLI